MQQENRKWEVIAHSAPIADTGDYDGHYELSNGDITLITRDDIDTDDPDIHIALYALGQYKWEDWKRDALEYELHLEKENYKKWKDCAQKLYVALGLATKHTYIQAGETEVIDKSIDLYQELIEDLP